MRRQNPTRQNPTRRHPTRRRLHRERLTTWGRAAWTRYQALRDAVAALSVRLAARGVRLRTWLRGRRFAGLEAIRGVVEHGAVRCGWRKAAPSLGEAGERAAAAYLGRLGYHLVARGARDRLGELDVVAVDQRTVVYVEVKTRRSEHVERPGEAVNREKRRRICLAANAFAGRHHLEHCRSRFDIIEVIWPEEARQPCIRHWPAAFESELDE